MDELLKRDVTQEMRRFATWGEITEARVVDGKLMAKMRIGFSEQPAELELTITHLKVERPAWAAAK